MGTDTTGVSRVGIQRVHLRYKLEFQSIKIKFQYIKVNELFHPYWNYSNELNTTAPSELPWRAKNRSNESSI